MCFRVPIARFVGVASAVRAGCRMCSTGVPVPVPAPLARPPLFDHEIIKSCEQFLITVHDHGSISWTTTIVLSMVTARVLVSVPLYAYQQRLLAKLENLKLDLAQLQDEVVANVREIRDRDQLSDHQCNLLANRLMRNEYKKLYIKENCHPMKATLLVLVQVPVWYSFSIALRNLSYPGSDSGAIDVLIANSELQRESFAWIPSLIDTDPFYVLPAMIAVANLTALELNYMKQISILSRTQQVVRNVFRAVSVLSIAITSFLPTCINVYWLSSVLFSVGQTLVFTVPKVRRLCRIPETALDLEQPFAYIKNELRTLFTRK